MPKVSRKQLEYAWAAGFIDGEGSFRLVYSRVSTKNRSVDKTRPRGVVLSISQVRREPLERIQQLLGGHISGPYLHNDPWGARKSPIHHYNLCKTDLDMHIEQLWCFLSLPKREQYGKCREAIDARAS